MSPREADPSFVVRGPELFAGPGQSRAALRAVDWADTPLGDVSGWPVDLLCATRTVLAAPTPMMLWWGEQFHQVHNDATLAAFGDAEPCLGRAAKQCWPERWDVLGPSARQVIAEGVPVRLDDVTLPGGDGAPRRWVVTLGALADEAGRSAGVLAAAIDLTDYLAAVEQERSAARDTTTNLQSALLSNRRIGTALGILMAQHRITDEAAFELLRAASQRSHRKLRDIADDVVLTGALSQDH